MLLMAHDAATITPVKVNPLSQGRAHRVYGWCVHILVLTWASQGVPGTAWDTGWTVFKTVVRAAFPFEGWVRLPCTSANASELELAQLFNIRDEPA